MNRNQSTAGPRAIALVLMVASLFAAGCENAGQGAVSGAGIGALSGLAIGSLSGEAGKGAAIGAVVGGVGGAVVGDQNRRQNEARQRRGNRRHQPRRPLKLPRQAARPSPFNQTIKPVRRWGDSSARGV